MLKQAFYNFEYILHVQGKELRGQMTVRTINRRKAEELLEKSVFNKIDAIGIEISEGGFWVEITKLAGNSLDELMKGLE